ncbi:hypothetical protein EDC22_102185 [Tepidamorphus gemmatus]|uniref:SLC41A/MgtE integral membrane domain-containing protein n=1 Tax=Tepidamorphus gemmatus TaxID=747076 RepID=A0A4R3MKX0_9HYPH|nr:magnesium transporter [Tepidamorphus gemmatus]TCT12500.1 hypothetical protein EDC22_102185 [Tepidamorphus gemmatus]
MPFLLSRPKLDPAAASAPLIASIADGTGVLIHFTIAATFLALAPAASEPVRGGCVRHVPGTDLSRRTVRR